MKIVVCEFMKDEEKRIAGMSARFVFFSCV